MNELDWLNSQRPDVAAPDEERTARARATLLAYAAGENASQRQVRRVRPASPDDLGSPRRGDAARHAAARRRGARSGPRKAPLYALAVVVFGIAIVVAAGALPSGDGAAPRIAGGPAPAEAALVTFARRIQQQPAPSGDATLVRRSHRFPDKHGFTGNDLYLDDGRYFYGMTMAELEAAKDDIGEGVPKLEREAAKAAITLAPDQARRKMIDATFGPPGEPAADSPQVKAAEAARREKLEHMTGPTPTPAPKRMIDDNRVWIGAMDALIAGAGDIDVRAGVMKLLSTIAAVKVSGHGATLDIRNTDFPDGYAETLTVDAKTGVIEKMTGGVVGKDPDVVVDYDIKRVVASEVLPALR